MTNIIDNFKALPTKTKGLLTAGTLLGLFVALPLFLYAVLNVNFDIRNKAASGEPITGEPIPTSTPVATVVPTPTPVSCLRKFQTVTMSPSNQTGVPGQTLTYSVTITNNDSAGCGSYTFRLDPLLPFSNWTATVGVPAGGLNLSPGQSVTAFLAITSSKTSPSGSVPVGVSVSGPMGVISASAAYTVQSSPTPSPTPIPYGGIINNGSFEINLDADRVPDFWTWGKTKAPDLNEGIFCGTSHMDGNCSIALNGGVFTKLVTQDVVLNSTGKAVFSLQAWQKASNAYGPGLNQIRLEFIDKNGKVVKSYRHNFKNGTHDFMQLSANPVRITTDKTFERLRLSLIYAKPFGKVWYDNLTLERTLPAANDFISTPTPTPAPVIQFIYGIFGGNSE